MNYEDLSKQEQEWITTYCNQTISEEEFAAFEVALQDSGTLRKATRQYLALDSNLRQGSESLAGIESAWNSRQDKKIVSFPKWIPIAAAAAIAFFIGIASNIFLETDTTPVAISTEEPTARGYAVIHGLVDATTRNQSAIREGDVLGAETLSLATGSARIDFFSGAQVFIEAPAELEIRSSWEAAFHSGKLRAKVPPAARGFVIESNGRRIIDLGTEFGIDTSKEEVKVEVFSGEVELEDRLLTKGQAVSLTNDGQTTPINSRIESFSNLFSIARDLTDSARNSFDEWRNNSANLSRDQRLIAYYPFIAKPTNRADWVPSGLYPKNDELDGANVMAEWVHGRWGELKGAMEFRRPGARVRVNIPGEFQAYTFSCWARIDSLDRKYNALFLADSYQNGEPHWQIRNDGVLMFGVMVDDTRPQPSLHVEAFEKGLVKVSAARNYYSPPIWDMSMSGQWMHLVSVYDPVNRVVAHYVDGDKVSSHKIVDDYHIETLRIGNAEIGNWGLPFRKDPEFAIRNLNGRIGELAIFNAALDASEIEDLFQQGQRK